MVQTIKPTDNENKPKKLTKATWVQIQNTEYKLKQYKLKVLKVSPLQNDEML